LLSTFSTLFARLQALVAQATVEALDETVLHRPAGLDEVEVDAVRLSPVVEVARRELGAVVGPQHPGHGAFRDHLVQDGGHPPGRHAEVHVDGQGLSREVVDDRDHRVQRHVGDDVGGNAVVAEDISTFVLVPIREIEEKSPIPADSLSPLRDPETLGGAPQDPFEASVDRDAS